MEQNGQKGLNQKGLGKDQKKKQDSKENLEDFQRSWGGR